MSDRAAVPPPTWPPVTYLLVLAVALGALVRLAPAISGGFPVNDGGLFAAYIDQVVANGFVPPEWLAYNGTDAPFAYPPAAFYLGATFVALGTDTLEVLRFVPVILSALAVVAWYLLARQLFGPTLGGIAAVVFALVPASFEWHVAGGGITRALSLLLVLLALRWVVVGFRSGARGSLVVGGIFLGLGALAHPEIGAFGFASAALFAWVERSGWGRLGAVLGVGLATTAPWLLLILVRYGLDPFLAVGQSRTASYLPTVLDIVGLSFTREAIVPLGAVLGAFGLFVAAASGRAWLIGWTVIAMLVAPSSSPALVMLPWSAAAAVTIGEIVTPRLRPRSRPIVLAGGMVVMVLASVLSPLLPASALRSLPPEVREAMAWVDDNLPPDAEVAVVSGAFWARDATAEWFPYLAHAHSVGTVQGQEFTGGWTEAVAGQRALVRCAGLTAECLADARADHFPDLEYVLIPYGPLPGSPSADCCLALRESLRETATVVHDGPGATIFAFAVNP